MKWWKLLLAGAALAVGVSSDERKGWATNQEYGGVHSEFKLGSDFGTGGVVPDRVEVVSSALRILPRKNVNAKEKSLGAASRVARSTEDDEDETRWALVPTKSVDKSSSRLKVDANRGAKSWLPGSGVSVHNNEKLISGRQDVHHDVKSRFDSSGQDVHHDARKKAGDSGLEVHREAEPKKLEWVKKVKSGLTVDNAERSKRSSGGWRTPREYQFVTRERTNDGAPRSARLLEPESSASRYYPDERPYYPESRRDDYFGRRSGEYRAPTKRIIYYATLPEIVRRPGEWTPPRPIYAGGGFPHNPRDNEILPRPDGPFSDGGTRVSSGVIGFSDKHETLKNPGYQDDLSSPTFTIIDAEPPYNYGHHSGPPPLPLPDRFDNRYDQDRYDQRYNSYRNNYADPYRQYYDRRAPPQPPRHPQISLPPQPITIVRKPLDVRPLDPDTDYTTQGPPHSSSTSASPSSSTSTTSSPQLSSYERTFERKFSH